MGPSFVSQCVVTTTNYPAGQHAWQPTSVTCFGPKLGAPHAPSTRVTGNRKPAPFAHQKITRARTRVHANAETSHAIGCLAFRLAEPRMIQQNHTSPSRSRVTVPGRTKTGQGKQAPRAPASLPLSCHATGTCGPSWTVALPRRGHARDFSSQRLIHRTPLPPHRLSRCSRHITAATPPLHSSSSRAEPHKVLEHTTPAGWANPTSQLGAMSISMRFAFPAPAAAPVAPSRLRARASGNGASAPGALTR
jgi:hypothetical protein